MANENARQDGNQFPALSAHSGTAGTAETRRVVAEDGALFTKAFSNLVPATSWDTVEVSYPSGTAETYVYKNGTTPVGTVSVIYLDSAKGSLSSSTLTTP